MSYRCPTCRAFPCETTGAARHGGGYHRRCPNGHEWDDASWSYMKSTSEQEAS